MMPSWNLEVRTDADSQINYRAKLEISVASVPYVTETLCFDPFHHNHAQARNPDHASNPSKRGGDIFIGSLVR